LFQVHVKAVADTPSAALPRFDRHADRGHRPLRDEVADLALHRAKPAA